MEKKRISTRGTKRVRDRLETARIHSPKPEASPSGSMLYAEGDVLVRMPTHMQEQIP